MGFLLRRVSGEGEKGMAHSEAQERERASQIEDR